MTPRLPLEFVLVSSDYAAVTAVSRGVKKYGAKSSLSPGAESARDSLRRRKVDGVFVPPAERTSRLNLERQAGRYTVDIWASPGAQVTDFKKSGSRIFIARSFEKPGW